MEALIGALFLTASNPQREARTGQTGLHRAFCWLNDIKCVPLRAAGIMDKISKVKRSSLDLNVPMPRFKFDQFDKIEDVYAKYFAVYEEIEMSHELARTRASIEKVFRLSLIHI